MSICRIFLKRDTEIIIDWGLEGWGHARSFLSFSYTLFFLLCELFLLPYNCSVSTVKG